MAQNRRDLDFGALQYSQCNSLLCFWLSASCFSHPIGHLLPHIPTIVNSSLWNHKLQQTLPSIRCIGPGSHHGSRRSLIQRLAPQMGKDRAFKTRQLIWGGADF